MEVEISVALEAFSFLVSRPRKGVTRGSDLKTEFKRNGIGLEYRLREFTEEMGHCVFVRFPVQDKLGGE